MLDHLGQGQASKAIEAAVAQLIGSGRIRSMQAGVHATDELGTMVADEVRATAPA